MRCIHLAPLREKRSIERAGVRGARVVLGSHVLVRAVYCMPVMQDYSMTFQWLRELRRWHGLPMAAVQFRVSDDLLCWVGRYGREHQCLPASQVAAWIEKQPWGAQMIIPEGIPATKIDKVREIPQLVGWTEVPEAERKTDCCCVACLPPGLPDLIRRLRGAYNGAIQDLHRASTVEEATAALARMEVPLERARGRRPGLSPKKLLGQLRSPQAAVRINVASLLVHFPWSEVATALDLLLEDVDPAVGERAVYSLWVMRGSLRAAEALRGRPQAQALLTYLDWEDDPEVKERALRVLGE